MIIGIIAARPGSILIRVSREMSFGPNTKPARRVFGSRAGRGEFLGMQHRARGLDHGPDLHGRRGAELGEMAADGLEILDA